MLRDSAALHPTVAACCTYKRMSKDCELRVVIRYSSQVSHLCAVLASGCPTQPLPLVTEALARPPVLSTRQNYYLKTAF